MNTGPTPAVNIVAGPDDHGVVEHAMTVAAATGSDVHRTPAGTTRVCTATRRPTPRSRVRGR